MSNKRKILILIIFLLILLLVCLLFLISGGGSASSGSMAQGESLLGQFGKMAGKTDGKGEGTGNSTQPGGGSGNSTEAGEEDSGSSTEAGEGSSDSDATDESESETKSTDPDPVNESTLDNNASGSDPTTPPDFIGAVINRPQAPVFRNRGVQGRAVAMSNGASRATFQAIDSGLVWLAKVQKSDGRWGSDHGHDLGCTGLAVLAFLGSGNSHLEGKYRANVRRGLDWIVARQKKGGSLGWKTFYEQGIAAMALCEDCSLTRNNRYQGAARLAIDHIVSKMGSDGGFGYRGAGSDTSVTGWQIMALKSALLAQVSVPRSAFEKEKIYLKKSVNPDGSTGYTYNKRATNSMTAIGMFCRIFLGYPKSDPNIRKAGAILDKAGPNINDEYGLYYATYCMFQWGGRPWARWNARFRDQVIARQEKKGPNMGSWEPTSSYKHGGKREGRVYRTAMYIMTLEVYQRYLPTYR